MVILEGIWNACIIIGAVILIALFVWALVGGAVHLGEAVARWWKNL